MKEWFTSTDLVGLAGLPKSRAKLLAKARREGWRSRERNTGKGVEFHIASLPATVSATLEKHHAVAEAKAETRRQQVRQQVSAEVAAHNQEQGLKDYMKLSESAKERADAKIAVLALAEQYIREKKLHKTAGFEHFCVSWNSRVIDVDAALTKQFPTLARATLFRWQKTLAEQGAATLAGKYNRRTEKSLIDRQKVLRDFIIALITEYPHTSTTNLLQAAVARFRNSDIQLPSERRLQVWVNRWKTDNKQLLMAVTNPDGWKNQYMTAFGDAAEDVERINQRWEADSTPADVMLLDGRHSIIGVIDVYTRRPMLLVSKSSKASAICLLMRRAFLEWGVPEQLKTDNGSDYKSRHMVRVLQSLGIEHKKCKPFSGWEKPHIERLFKTFSHSLVEMLDGYIGHNVTDRKAIESRKAFSDRLMEKDGVVEINLTAQQLQDHCDRWINHIYMHNHHESLGMTPFDAVAAARTPIRAIADPRTLDVLLAESPGDGYRTIGKKGILIDGIHYIAAELGPLVGQRVHVRFSEQLGYVYVFNDEGFVCVAEAPDYTGISRQEVASHARERQKKDMQDARRALKASARKLNTRNAAEEILSSREQDTGNLVAMPQRRITHETDAITAAQQAVELTPATADIVSLSMQAPVRKTYNDPRANHAAWLRVEMRIVQGMLVSREDREGLAIYKQSNEYQSMQTLFNDFGLNADSF